MSTSGTGDCVSSFRSGDDLHPFVSNGIQIEEVSQSLRIEGPTKDVKAVALKNSRMSIAS